MRLVIFGVSNVIGHFFDCAIALGLTPSLVVMNTPEILRPRTRSVHERIRVLSNPPKIITMEDFSPSGGECYFVGTTALDRRQLVDHLKTLFGITCCSLIHPAACISPHAEISNGTYVSMHTSIGPGARVGQHVFVGAKVHIGHDATIESYARVLSGSNVAGHTRIGRGATVGMGATIIEELDIGEEAYVAAGAVVIKDVAARTMVAGVPAHTKKTL